MSADMMDRSIEPVLPVNSLLANEVLRVKSVSRDADKRPDDKFEQQLKKKKQEDDAGSESQQSEDKYDSADDYPKESFVRDEFILSGEEQKSLSRLPSATEQKPNPSEPDKENHGVDIIA